MSRCAIFGYSQLGYALFCLLTCQVVYHCCHITLVVGGDVVGVAVAALP